MKRRADFHFKQFSVAHDRVTHKIGTDGVLLGAWVDVDDAVDILDIGTGSGVIALMLAQRTGKETHIDAVEIAEEDTLQAKENVNRSPWPAKVEVVRSSIQDFAPQKKYDLIVSNPPYFINSWKSPDDRRSTARHTDSLTFDELLQSVVRLMKNDGHFAVVLPYKEGHHFVRLAEKYDLKPTRQLSLRSREDKPIERVCFELSHREVPLEIEELVLHSQGDEWSEPYKNLTRGFYLKA